MPLQHINHTAKKVVYSGISIPKRLRDFWQSVLDLNPFMISDH